MRWPIWRFIFSLGICLLQTRMIDAAQPRVSFDVGDHELVISIGDVPVASYVFVDPNIPRPYFAHIKTLNGEQVSRHHPPIDGEDATDHATMHPGIWLAFGDLDGTDFWRNKGRIKHARFIKIPVAGPGQGEFTQLKEYVREDGRVICQEVFTCRVVVIDDGYVLEIDSTFTSPRSFYFGDQEEMGLGIRVATAIAEVNGGALSDSAGRTSAKQIWSQSADWCDYRGLVNGQRIGMTILCHPRNPRPSWMHARNYGFVAANMFGRKAMNKGAESKWVVSPEESLRISYGVAVCSQVGQPAVNIDSIYQSYVRRNQ